MEQIVIAILAGGRSRRMGRDKAALPWNGEPLLEHLAIAALSTRHLVRVIGRPQPEDWKVAGVDFLPDRYPDVGPLGGVLTALEAGAGSILAVACDMPHLDGLALDWLLDTANRLPPHSPGVAARNGDQIEPLFAVYGQSLREPMRARIAAGRLSLNGLIQDAALTLVDAPEEIRRALMNVNTPEEWRDLNRKEH
ncbi:MAG: molybdenum cofactor guanylyltransferase [Capsulimonas sp.]|uniref:molybdenum cofactor guanylyltransferase n=1 Tax=Capsulimonas sp. TaxID=2494211 RepID=UPI0032656BD2